MSEQSPKRSRTGRKRANRDDTGERGLRGLAGAGPSQVSVERALRARDVNRPTAADLEAAEREVTIVRRDWRPDERR